MALRDAHVLRRSPDGGRCWHLHGTGQHRHPSRRFPETTRLHEFAAELNGVHAAEFEESLRRLGFGLTMFIQHSPHVDLVLSVVEGDDPSSALGKLAMSSHPFDRWHLQQIVDQTGLDLSAPRPPPNEQLWVWQQAVPVLPGGKP